MNFLTTLLTLGLASVSWASFGQVKETLPTLPTRTVSFSCIDGDQDIVVNGRAMIGLDDSSHHGDFEVATAVFSTIDDFGHKEVTTAMGTVAPDSSLHLRTSQNVGDWDVKIDGRVGEKLFLSKILGATLVCSWNGE